jgi:hypothetical protein
MSETPLPAHEPPPQRHGCLTALMAVSGVILLLPGICSLIFGGAALFSTSYDPGFTPFIAFGLLVGGVGVLLIRAAVKKPPRQVRSS